MKELEIRIQDPKETEEHLRSLGAVFTEEKKATDTYFTQPECHVLKIVESTNGNFIIKLENNGEGFTITEKTEINNVKETKAELTQKYGIHKILKKKSRYFTLEKYKVNINIIENVGDFLIVTSENPQKEFIEQTIGIQNPEYITVPFSDL